MPAGRIGLCFARFSSTKTAICAGAVPYPSCPFVPFVDLPALASDHSLSETHPPFLAEPLPPTHQPRQYLPSPKQKISDCATLLSHHQNCLAARLWRQQFPFPKQQISDFPTKDFRLCYFSLAPPTRTQPHACGDHTNGRKEMSSTPCKSLKKDGTPCRGNGLEQLDGYCIAHAPADKAWQWRSRGGKASSAAARADKRIPDRLSHAIDKLSTGMDQVLEGKLEPPPSPPFPAPQRCSSNSTASPTTRWT